MNAEEYRETLERAGLSLVGAARLFRVNERTSRRWALGEDPVPRAVEIALWLMVKFKVKPSTVLKQLGPDQEQLL